MPKDKKKQKVVEFPWPALHPTRDPPSESCKNFLIELIVRFYEQNSTRCLESKYVRYRDEGPDKFKSEMTLLMTEALKAPVWEEEMAKRGSSQWLANRAHDALWNSKNILAKYKKQYREGDEAFNDVVLKADLFVTQMRPFAKNRNRRGSVGWWNSEEGRREDQLRTSHLIALPATARVRPQDNHPRRGGGMPLFGEFVLKERRALKPIGNSPQRNQTIPKQGLT